MNEWMSMFGVTVELKMGLWTKVPSESLWVSGPTGTPSQTYLMRAITCVTRLKKSPLPGDSESVTWGEAQGSVFVDVLLLWFETDASDGSKLEKPSPKDFILSLGTPSPWPLQTFANSPTVTNTFSGQGHYLFEKTCALCWVATGVGALHFWLSWLLCGILWIAIMPRKASIHMFLPSLRPSLRMHQCLLNEWLNKFQHGQDKQAWQLWRTEVFHEPQFGVAHGSIQKQTMTKKIHEHILFTLLSFWLEEHSYNN